MEQEVLNLANEKVQLIISNALNCLSQILPNRSFRCRSSSYSKNHRKNPFHNAIPRYSIPTTKNDFVHYQSRCQIPSGLNKCFDIQYSFSLHEFRLTKMNQKIYYFNSIENFADEFVKHSIQLALLQINNNNNSSDEDECFQVINSYADEFIHTTIEQAIETIFSSKIERFSNYLAEDIITDALSIIAHDEIYSRKIKKKSIQFENDEQQMNLFNENPHTSSSVISTSNVESIDTLVINIAQQIYTNSFDQLRQILTQDNNNE